MRLPYCLLLMSASLISNQALAADYGVYKCQVESVGTNINDIYVDQFDSNRQRYSNVGEHAFFNVDFQGEVLTLKNSEGSIKLYHSASDNGSIRSYTPNGDSSGWKGVAITISNSAKKMFLGTHATDVVYRYSCKRTWFF